MWDGRHLKKKDKELNLSNGLTDFDEILHIETYCHFES